MQENRQIISIHQFSPSCSKGDGVSNGMFLTRSLLRELGFTSEIFSELIPDELRHDVKYLHQLELKSDDILLFHHSLGYPNFKWIDEIKVKKILVYHNITPPEFLPANGLPELSILGREQLRSWVDKFHGAIGDSELNSAELIEAGYANVKTIPLLVDVDYLPHIQHDAEYAAQWRGTYNILFVGRFCKNKHQLELIDLVQALSNQVVHPIRLILAGGVTSDEYLQRVQSVIRERGLEALVTVTGKISDTRLAALYRSADLYLSLSEHEGFGMPIIEAMLHDVPVVARACAGVVASMGEGGKLMSVNCNLNDYVVQIKLLMNEAELRRQIIKTQRRNVQRFSRSHLLSELVNYLGELGVSAPQRPVSAPKEAHAGWQIEGPFDSSYSLAIVNRELARALEKLGSPIALRSKEGFGDFVANPEFLLVNPDLAVMQNRATEAGSFPDIALRDCYPPFLDDMQGRIKVVHSYGWEESSFPADYVNAFNRKLDLVTVMSKFVAKVLRDSGVAVPIAVTGIGVDHLLSVESEAMASADVASWRTFRFLHVSSCFPRKGVDALLAAYAQAFRFDDDVTLIIKTFPNPHNDVEEQVASWRLKDKNFPHVVVINQDFSDALLVGLYHACHALVMPSRGEGFCLPVAEAMLFKLPVITTAWSGQRDFADEATAWLCDFEFEKANSHLALTHSVWANPDVNHLATLMRELYECPEEKILARTSIARQRILQNFTWADAARRTVAAINAIDHQILPRKKPKIGWISTWNARCGIATYSSFLGVAIPQDRLTLFTNYTAERTARDADNVLRCWTSGMDEEMDYALESILERDIDVVVIQYNYGFFSLAVLANLIHQLKHAGIAVHIFFHATADVMWGDKKVTLSAIADDLQLVDRLYVHGVDDLNRFKKLGLVDNVVFFPHGLLPTKAVDNSSPAMRHLKGNTVIAAYGFLLPHKGIQALIRAFSIMAEQDKNLHLLLVNALYPVHESEQELRACQALIAELNLADQVDIQSEFLPDEESRKLLQRADLIVYSYQQTQESASGAVRMGLSAGKPVAVTPLSIFDDVADAVHVLPGTTPEAMAMGITALLNDAQRLEAKAQQAKQWVSIRQWPALSARLLNLIDGLENQQETTLETHAGNL